MLEFGKWDWDMGWCEAGCEIKEGNRAIEICEEGSKEVVEEGKATTGNREFPTMVRPECVEGRNACLGRVRDGCLTERFE